jgi:hypothetical protein
MFEGTYNVVQELPEIEYYVNIAPITKSALDLAEEIKDKFNFKISPQTIRNYRKKMPKTKIRHLHEERTKNIKSLQFLVEILKEQLKDIDDSNLKLEYIQEILGCVKEINALTEYEMEYLKTISPF